MLSTNNIIKALKGNESLLLIFSKDAINELGIADEDLLEFQIRNKELVIKKIDYDKITLNDDMGDSIHDTK